MQTIQNALQIYCRFRSRIVETESNDEDTNECKIIAISDKVVSLSSRNSFLEQQFAFDHVFDETCCQERMFNDVGRPLIETLIRGNDVLLFAYGVTSSGKSYTINGTPQFPGIIPRSIAYLFYAIPVDKINKKNQILSDCQNGFVFNNQLDDQKQSETFFENTVYLSSLNRKKFPNTLYEWSKAKIEFDDEMFSTIKNWIVDNRHFSLFITFVEIYNNYIYDLLEVQNSQNIKWERTPRQLLHDANQMTFVQGAREIEVTDLDQAFKVFLYGLQNRRLGQTSMNENSSRSHSIFTIKLVYFNGNPNDQPELKVNQFSIVDLAGLERANRTKNTGMKLFEASNINNSLMVLRSCFDAMQKNLNNPTKKNKLIVPYRQSKLTHLLKRFFEFRSQIRMLICIKSDVEDFDENLQVLNFGHKAQKIVIEDFQQNGNENDEQCQNKNDILELNLIRFNAEQVKQKTFHTIIKEIEKYLQNYESDLNQIFSKVELILHNLDANLKHYPELQVDRKSIPIRLHRVNFINLTQKLMESYEQNNPSPSIITVTTPAMYSNKKNLRTKIIEEFHRDLNVWDNESVELENKFASLLVNCNRYVDRSFGGPSSSSSQRIPLKQMDVFNRLYYQSPARYKFNQSLNRSIIEGHRQIQSSSSKLMMMKRPQKVIRKLILFKQPNGHYNKKKDFNGKGDVEHQPYKSTNEIIKTEPKPKRSRPMHMSSKIETICRKFESIFASGKIKCPSKYQSENSQFKQTISNNNNNNNNHHHHHHQYHHHYHDNQINSNNMLQSQKIQKHLKKNIKRKLFK